MTSREAAIYQLKQLKGQPLKKKISYIFTYFWIPIVAILAAIISLVSMIVHWASIKPTALTLCCVNSTVDLAAAETYLQDFAGAQGIDTEQYQLTVETMFLGDEMGANYQNAEVFAAMLIAGDLDVLTADHTTAIRYAYQETFLDLSELLTQEQLDALAPYLLYIDLSLLDEMDAFFEEAPEYPDPTKPEEMEQPVPVAITLQPDWAFTKACHPYTYGKDALGLVAGSNNADNAVAFLNYILDQEGI